MAFCAKCGTSIADGVAFCPQCGTPTGPVTMGTPAPVSGPPLTAAPVSTGLAENVAGLLCYLLGWITGIIFLLIDKRPFVRFHAAQSIVVFGALTIIRIVLAFAFAGSWYFGLGVLHMMIFGLLGVLGLALWIILMIQAYQGKWFEIPGAAGVAKNIAGKVQ